MSKKSINIGYNDTSYDLNDNWNYKKKRIFKKKKLQVKNLNILIIITLILSSIYIPLNYCIFNFNIPFSTDGEDENANRNFCQNSILYILNFKNIYISSIFYISTFVSFVYVLYISPISTLIYKHIIVPYIYYSIGCTYEYIDNLVEAIKHINILIKEKQYAKLYDLFCKFMILLIILLVLIAILIFIALAIYNYISNDNLSFDNIGERVEAKVGDLSDAVNDIQNQIVDINDIVKKI